MEDGKNESGYKYYYVEVMLVCMVGSKGVVRYDSLCKRFDMTKDIFPFRNKISRYIDHMHDLLPANRGSSYKEDTFKEITPKEFYNVYIDKI